MDTRSNSFLIVNIVPDWRGDVFKVLYEIHHPKGSVTKGWSIDVRAKDEIEAWFKAYGRLIQHYKEKELPNE